MKVNLNRKSLMKLGKWTMILFLLVLLGVFVTQYIVPVLASIEPTQVNDTNVTILTPTNYSYQATSNVNFTYNVSWNTDFNLHNCTLFGNFTNTSFIANETNSSLIVNNVANGLNNTLNDGLYIWNVYCYNTTSHGNYSNSNYTIIVDTIDPGLSNNLTSLQSEYSSTASMFNVTVNDTYLDTALIWSNHSNFCNNNCSMTDLGGSNYSYNDTLPAGHYNWTVYANDSAGNVNQTDYWVFTITKRPANITVYLNGSITDRTDHYYHYGDIANLTVDLNVSDKAELWTNFTGTYALWNTTSDPLVNNYTLMNYTPGLYNVTGSIQTGSENNTFSNYSLLLTIWGYAEINESSHVSTMTATTTKHLACRVRENTSTAVISNYNVSFWDNITGYLGSDLTNSTGWANISISYGTTGPYNITCNITSNSSIYYNVSVNNFNFSYLTVTAAPTTSTTIGGGGGGGGGGGAVTKPTKVTHKFLQLKKNTITKWKINQPGLGLIEMNMTVQNPANNVQITIKKTDGRPASVIHEVSGKVYHYLEITKTNIEDTDIDKIKLKINVNKSWITDNNIDENTVALNRYHNNAWEKLPTSKVEEDDDYVYYVAEMTGLSVFAVTGEVKTTVTTTVPTTLATTVPTTVATTVPTEPVIEGMPTWSFGIIILVIIIAIGLWWTKKKRPQKKKTIPK